jgi:hypothetical protein
VADHTGLPMTGVERGLSVSDAHKALIGAIRNELEDSGLEITSSNREITITDPRLPEKGSFIFDCSARYLAWERQEYDYWNFDHLTEDQVAVFIVGKIREVLGERARLASEFEAWVELARREELSARVMSGELDDVELYVRRP